MLRGKTAYGYNLESIVMAVHTWESLWQRQKILFHCNNQAVVSVWKAGSTKAKETMALIRLLYYSAAKHNISVCTAHIAGAKNNIADCLSRFQQVKFKKLRSTTGDSCTGQHLCLADTVLHRSLMQCCHFGVAPSTHQTYQSGLTTFNTFCRQFGIVPFLASSLTLEYFCAHASQQISYKALKA